MDLRPNNITIISEVCGVQSKKGSRWYKEHLSGFRDAQTQKQLHENDLGVTAVNGKRGNIAVPILEWNNFGKNMAIDEKHLGNEIHTVLSNRDTGKIALLAQSVRYDDLRKLLPQENIICRNVDTLTRDLSRTYRKLADYSFFNASHIADKFHIVKQLMDALQELRRRERQELLRKKRIAYDQHRRSERQRRISCKEQGISFTPNRFSYKEDLLRNGETQMELLARSQYLLYAYQQDWTENQKYRAKILFEKYPQIEQAYTLACDFRQWYKRDVKINSRSEKHSWLHSWYKRVEDTNIDELLDFKSTVERNEHSILNYFSNGHTNAIAENINSRLQQFISSNRGVRDIDFVYFKIRKMFAEPQHC
jgi:hypothetical protein